MTLLGLLEKVRDELPECELTSVVSMESGLALAAAGPRDAVDAAMADAFSNEVYRLIGDVVGAIPENVVIRGPETVFVSMLLGETGYFWHMSTSADVTLGFTQAVMRKYEAHVTEAVRGLVRISQPG